MKVGDPKLDAIVERPVRHLAHIGAHSRLWRVHDHFRAEYRKLKSWPTWCYAPLTVMQACLVSTSEAEEVVGAAAMAAWRLTKGIYLFDATVFDALWATDVEGVLPVELLQRLPEWCVYVPFPGPKIFTRSILRPIEGEVTVHGFFAHLDWAHLDGSAWLHLCLDTDAKNEPFPTQLCSLTIRLEGNLSDACHPFRQELEASLEAKASNAAALGVDFQSFKAAALDWADRQKVDIVRPMVSILLWLCSTNPEISGLDPLRGLRTKKTKKGVRHFSAEEPRVYEVAYRIGATLRLNRAAMGHAARGDGTHASPRPHIRRAHWHAFWTGPKASVTKEQPTERKLILKWVPPIFVCAGTGGDTIIPTVHPVVDPAGGTFHPKDIDQGRS